MAGGQVRYARYILLAVVTLFALYYLSSSSIPTHYEKYTKYAQPLKDQMPSFGKPWERLQSQGTSDSPVSSHVSEPVDSTSPAMESFLAEVAPGERANATFVTLARNADLWEIARSIRQVEDRFNRKYNYPWVFLNDAPFEENFIKVTSSLVSGKTYYGVIPSEHWSFPPWIDQEKARLVREDMRARKIIYGDSISYRHMCRFESGFFFRQKLLDQFEYYWRVEPSIELFCDIDYDPFKFMKDNNKQYSFVLSLYEYIETIPTLWDSVKKFMKAHPEHLASNNALGFLSDDGGESYNKCHFWSNFEIGNLNWLRSQKYLDFFDSLDRDGGFFYERWGDAPIHSIAAGLMLNKTDIHFFNDIAYYHVPFTHCPTGDDLRLKLKCHCDPKNNFDWKGYSCTNRCWTWVFFKSAVLSATAMCVFLFIIMNVPFTRRRILRLADKLADWHERGVADDEDEDEDDRYEDKKVRATK